MVSHKSGSVVDAYLYHTQLPAAKLECKINIITSSISPKWGENVF